MYWVSDEDDVLYERGVIKENNLTPHDVNKNKQKVLQINLQILTARGNSRHIAIAL